MRNCGKAFIAVAFCCAFARPAFAQPAFAQNDPAARFETAREQERLVSESPAAAAEDFRFVVNRYWSIVRSYPASGYASNALWQAANLSMEAFRRFSDVKDKDRAVRLFEWLRRQYPRSSTAARAMGQLEQLSGLQPASEATIRAVRREILPEVTRITVEIDREVPFSQEQLAAPSRVFFDLKGTKTAAPLQDAVLRYDADVVREIRFGRHPNNTTRIVVDLQNVAHYSVFTLYEPYRIVIDCERATTGAPGSQVASAVKPASVATAGRIPPPGPVASVPRAAPAESPAPAPVARVAPPAPAPHAPLAAVAPHGSRPTLAPEPTAPLTRLARVAPAAPPEAAPQAQEFVLSGKPLAPSANSSGKFSVARQLGLGVSRIVIDPGHGGHDPGATAFSVSEAELVLDVALRLEALLQQQGTEVVLTRRTNDYLSLEERTNIANRESADLFLSIHANASAVPTARGIETYFLNFALNRQAEAVAARENAASEKTMNSLPGIIKAITLNSKLNESRDFAALIQRSLVRGLTPSNKALKDLGIKQAPFMVLIGASMPSVLAEIAFVTNRQEARLLKSPAYRQKIAESLLSGILKYQQALKKVQTAALN
jgi:N-acetylmuramoyl-L-alanine amidase